MTITVDLSKAFLCPKLQDLAIRLESGKVVSVEQLVGMLTAKEIAFNDSTTRPKHASCKDPRRKNKAIREFDRLALITIGEPHAHISHSNLIKKLLAFKPKDGFKRRELRELIEKSAAIPGSDRLVRRFNTILSLKKRQKRKASEVVSMSPTQKELDMVAALPGIYPKGLTGVAREIELAWQSREVPPHLLVVPSEHRV